MKNEKLTLESELKAHLYQQLQKLEPHIKVQGQLGFEKIEDGDDDSKMRLIYLTPLFQLQAEGEGGDDFEASTLATEKMIKALEEIDDIVAESLEDTEPISGYLH
jgi:hypothetical protein